MKNSTHFALHKHKFFEKLHLPSLAFTCKLVSKKHPTFFLVIPNFCFIQKSSFKCVKVSIFVYKLGKPLTRAGSGFCFRVVVLSLPEKKICLLFPSPLSFQLRIHFFLTICFSSIFSPGYVRLGLLHMLICFNIYLHLYLSSLWAGPLFLF